MNPHAPILYGLPKIHKTNIPIRPVVSYVNAPVVKICKYLNNLLNNIFVSPFSVSYREHLATCHRTGEGEEDRRHNGWKGLGEV